MGSKLLLVNVPTVDFKKSLQFYATLLGIKPNDLIKNASSDLEQYHYPLSSDGVDLTISAKSDTRDTTLAYFAVDDLAHAVSALTEAGGRVVVEPTGMHERGGAKGSYEERPSFGQRALMVDPDGNFIGLVQLVSPEAQRYFHLGAHEKGRDQALEERLALARSGGPAH